MAVDPGPPKRSNVQGLIWRGYGHRYSTHMLFKFPGRDAAAAFLEPLLPHLQSAVEWGTEKPSMMLNVGLTYAGIQKSTALTANDMKQFPPTFRLGPTSGDSPGSLSDLGDSRPSNWWSKNFPTSDIHCVVHTYAVDAVSMEAIVAIVAAAAAKADVKELFPMAGGGRLTQAQLPKDYIHFGYRDGISEPPLTWPVPGSAPDPGTLDNFVIGYPGSTASPGPAGNDAAGAFAKDGCYSALRVLSQDVDAFEKFLTDNAEMISSRLGKSIVDAREWLAAKVMGRWRNGSPLVMSPDAPSEVTREGENFGYVGDPSGMKCPFSAHTRVSNPRDEPVGEADKPVPRLIRRGMPYGEAEGEDRGLIGIFLCGALAGQFETIYGWMNANNFSDLFSPGFDTQDAVVGNRLQPDADLSFSIPTSAGPIKIAKLPQFLTTKGTAYFLLPSIATLQRIAAKAV